MKLRSSLVASSSFLVVLGALAALAGPAWSLQEAQAKTPEVFERADASGRPRARVTETIIGFDDPGMIAESMQPSPDGRRLAYVTLEGGGATVVVDGVKGESFEGYAAGSLVFSKDGKHLAYVGTRPGRQYVVLDGKVHEYEGVSKQGVVFAPEGSRVAWVAQRESTQLAVIDGVESSPYQGIPPPGILFSPDGKRTAYIASTGGKSLVVLDGEEGPLFDEVRNLRFGANGKHALYMARRKNESFAVVDATTYGPFEELQARPDLHKTKTNDPFEVSVDGAHVGFAAKRASEWFVVIDGKELGPYQNVALLALSPDGSHVVHVANRGEGWITLVDGEERKGRIPDGLSFSSDSKHMAWILKRGDKRVVQVEGVEGKPYQRIQPPGVLFSADCKHYAYAADQDDQTFVVVDGVERPGFRRLGKIPLLFIQESARTVYSVVRMDGEGEALVIDGVEGPVFKSIRTPAFSADGTRYAYAAEKMSGGWVVVLDGDGYGPGGKLAPDATQTYPMVGRRTPIFSADGKRVAWTTGGDEGQLAVIDGKESPRFEIAMASSLSFSPDSRHVVFAGQREGKQVIVVDGFEFENGWNGFHQQLDDLVWSDPTHFSLRALRTPRFVLVQVEIL